MDKVLMQSSHKGTVHHHFITGCKASRIPDFLIGKVWGPHALKTSFLFPAKGLSGNRDHSTTQCLQKGQQGVLAAQLFSASHRAGRKFLLHSSSVLCTRDKLNPQADSRYEPQEVITAHMDAQFSSLSQRGLLIHGKCVVVMSCQVTFLRVEY